MVRREHGKFQSMHESHPCHNILRQIGLRSCDPEVCHIQRGSMCGGLRGTQPLHTHIRLLIYTTPFATKAKRPKPNPPQNLWE